jgi:hypothetical protein
VFIYFDVCAAIAENTRPCGNCGRLAWERTCRLNNKYIYPEDDIGTSGCAHYEQLSCHYWGCERCATWLKGEIHTSDGTASLSEKREATPDCTLGGYNSEIFTIFNLNEIGWKVGKKFDILLYEKEETLVLCCIFNSS